MTGWREPYFCEMEDCGKVAVLALEAHARSESLLSYNLHYVCANHWYEPVRDVVREMLKETDVTGLSIVLP